MALASLQELYVDELKDLYSAENQILKALPKIAEKASDAKLRSAFEQHMSQTKEHVARIEQICEELDVSPKGKLCKGMQGLLEEGEELLKEDADPDVLDAGLIAAAQRVEHYEIAAYGTARTFANQLGFGKAARLLQQTLDEEGETDQKLTELAEAGINEQAIAA